MTLGSKAIINYFRLKLCNGEEETNLQCAMVKKRPRRKPKQKLVDVSLVPTDKRLRLVQRGIQDFFKQQDGPMGVKQHGTLEL